MCRPARLVWSVEPRHNRHCESRSDKAIAMAKRTPAGATHDATCAAHGAGFPQFVKAACDVSLACGRLAQGFVGCDHRIGHLRPPENAARILTCHLSLGREGLVLTKYRLGWPT